jgi:hypothetical protein
MADKPLHYQNSYTRPLTPEEMKSGILNLKLDPYRIADIFNLGGGAREQIMKKALRWTTKGDDERKVINEIMQACERRLEMLDEDTVKLPVAPIPVAMAPMEPQPIWLDWKGLFASPGGGGRVEVMFRDGCMDTGPASEFRWTHDACGSNPGNSDIIKFRYI